MATASAETTIQDAALGAVALDRLREALEDRRAAQVDLASESDAIAAGDGGAEGADRELAGASAARARELIDEIDAALRRIDERSYGRCERCQGPIPIDRLEAIPHARFCIRCAEVGVGFLG